MIKSLFRLWNRFLKKVRLYSAKNSIIDKTAKLGSGTLLFGSLIGRNSYCGYDCIFINTNIGSFCSIASNVVVGGMSHPMHYVSTSPVFLAHKDSLRKKYSKFVYLPKIVTTIGSDVWIGDGVYIKGGVSIGDGAVVGMGSVVTKDVPAYAVVAGNPAKLIKYRFDKEIRDALVEIKWWERDDSWIESYSEYFDNPLKLIEGVRAR